MAVFWVGHRIDSVPVMGTVLQVMVKPLESIRYAAANPGISLQVPPTREHDAAG